MAKKQAYVVWHGRIPGVYLTWAECEAQVSGYPGAEFKGFTNADEARRSWEHGHKPAGGHGYVHAIGIQCGHHHTTEVSNWNRVTCPGCRRSMEGLEPPPVAPPKAKKTKPAPPKFRLWNLKTAAWASEQRHDTYQQGLNEKLARVAAADPRAKEWARASLVVFAEDAEAERTRRQESYDRQFPHIAAKRGTTTQPDGMQTSAETVAV